MYGALRKKKLTAKHAKTGPGVTKRIFHKNKFLLVLAIFALLGGLGGLPLIKPVNRMP